MGPIKTYQRLLRSHFLLVQSAQTAFLMGFGDFLSQKAVERKPWKDYQFRRTGEFAFLGACLVAPAVSVWYKFLAKQFGSDKNPTTTLKKVAADQLLFAPGFLVVFITSVGLLHQENMAQIKKDIDSKYFDILTTNWIIFPTVQLVNFYFVPLKYQLVTVQCVAVFWNTYLTWKTSQSV